MLNACSTAKIANPTGWTASIYQSASSTKIGCLPEEITITDLDQHGGFSRARDWFATCKGKHIFVPELITAMEERQMFLV